jgi:hypothetical protein
VQASGISIQSKVSVVPTGPKAARNAASPEIAVVVPVPKNFGCGVLSWIVVMCQLSVILVCLSRSSSRRYALVCRSASPLTMSDHGAFSPPSKIRSTTARPGRSRRRATLPRSLPLGLSGRVSRAVVCRNGAASRTEPRTTRAIGRTVGVFRLVENRRLPSALNRRAETPSGMLRYQPDKHEIFHVIIG